MIERRIRTFQILGLIIALSSLTLSIGTLTTTYAYTGIATVSKEKYEVTIKDVTDFFEDGENITIVKNPIIVKNDITYGLSLGQVNEYTKFQFNVDNTGNVNAKVKEINITGLEAYQDNIEISIKGLEVNQIIEPNAIQKVDVITTYKNPLFDENENIMPIALNEININIELEKE